MPSVRRRRDPVFDGADEYKLLDGRWHLSRGAPGTRATTNPAWLLGLLAEKEGVHGIRSEADGELHGELDLGLAARTMAGGLWQEWELRVGVRLLEGKMRMMRLEHVDAESQTVGTKLTFELRPVPAIAPIDLPPPMHQPSAPPP